MTDFGAGNTCSHCSVVLEEELGVGDNRKRGILEKKKYYLGKMEKAGVCDFCMQRAPLQLILHQPKDPSFPVWVKAGQLCSGETRRGGEMHGSESKQC